MNSYQVISASGLKARVLADDLMEAGRIFRRENPGEVIVEIKSRGALGSKPRQPRTTVVDGKREQIPVGYYRVRKGLTKAGDLAWWASNPGTSLHGFHPVDASPPGRSAPVNKLGVDIVGAAYYCILRKQKD